MLHLDSWEESPQSAEFWGSIFERHALELLEKGGEFRRRQLVHGKKKIKPTEYDLEIQPSTKLVVDEVLPNQIRDQLYVPKRKNFRAIAWITGIGAFQVTLGLKKHELKDCVRDYLPILEEGANKLFWLVPSPNYESFTKKSLQEIDQYAVRIPYPE